MLIEQIFKFELRGPGIPGHRPSPGSSGIPLIEMLSMTKMWQKSLLFLQFQFLLASFAYNAFF